MNEATVTPIAWQVIKHFNYTSRGKSDYYVDLWRRRNVDDDCWIVDVCREGDDPICALIVGVFLADPSSDEPPPEAVDFAKWFSGMTRIRLNSN